MSCKPCCYKSVGWGRALTFFTVYWGIQVINLLVSAAMMPDLFAKFEALFAKLESGQPLPQEATRMVAEAVGGMTSVALVISVVGVFMMIFVMMMHYRCWKAIPCEFRRTSPAKAVGFLFIPFFNLGWIFISIYGLGRDMNRYLESTGRNEHRNRPGLGMALCILLLVSVVASTAMMGAFPIVVASLGLKGLADALLTSSLFNLCWMVAFYVVWLCYYRSLSRAADLLLTEKCES
ncbi:hypothetical protein JYU14_00140 [Simkania negevensis]|uniref:DUF4328 domain-containing protein n=1 Tax=Simkania negevensis TaxID=83561 RepID=A0ABS3AQ77_9BACT|nr:hypothetical protein [Simkania negevensis]